MKPAKKNPYSEQRKCQYEYAQNYAPCKSFPVHPVHTQMQADSVHTKDKDQSSIGSPDQYLPHEICDVDELPDGIQFEL
jgi:hypothetical protein